MPYIPKEDRNQMMFCSMDSFVAPDSMARVIDAFVEHLDLEKVGIQKEAAREGRPGYDPRCLLKLYIYGCRNAIRSSRKLEQACKVNLEVRWMIGGLTPDFHTISDFRKDNNVALKKVFHEFNRKVASAIATGFYSIDGTKVLAVNSKDNNFISSKLDDRIKWLDAHCGEYMRQLE